MIRRVTTEQVHKGRTFYASVLSSESNEVERWSLIVGNVDLSKITLEQLKSLFDWDQSDIDAMNAAVAEQLAQVV